MQFLFVVNAVFACVHRFQGDTAATRVTGECIQGGAPVVRFGCHIFFWICSCSYTFGLMCARTGVHMHLFGLHLARIRGLKVYHSETRLLLALCVLSGYKETGLGTDSLSFPHKPFSFKDFSLWLNKVLMEGDKSMWLAQSDFPFYCHFKVICYMSHSQFPSTCDR